jgi:hypothetical protein
MRERPGGSAYACWAADEARLHEELEQAPVLALGDE